MTCIEYKDYTDKFKLIGRLGDGNYSSVLKIQDIKTKKQYALKYSKLDSPAKLALAFQEIEVIRALDHPCAIEIYYYFVKTTPGQQFVNNKIEMGIVMQLADRSLEQDVIARRKKQRYYSQQQIYQILKSLLSLFAHAQRKGYLHRDIKPANILILSPPDTPAERLKVCDFGFALKNHQFADKNIAGTSAYASPKILSKFQHSQIFINGNNYKDDVYSLGVTMLELCTLQSAELVSPQRLLTKVNTKYGLRIATFIKSMVEFDQAKRSDFIQLKELLPQYFSKSCHQLNDPQGSKGINKTIVPNSIFLRQQEDSTLACLKIERLKYDKQKSLEQPKTNDESAKSLPRRIQEEMDRDEENVSRNCTPRTNKNEFNHLRRSLLMDMRPESAGTDDKARTKRRSKILNNHTLDKFFLHQQAARLSVDQKGIQPKDSPQPKICQNANILQEFSLKGMKIKQCQIIQLDELGEYASCKIILCLNTSHKLFACLQAQNRQDIIQVKLSERLSGVQLIKYSWRRRQLIMACQNGTIASISGYLLMELLLRPNPSINFSHVNTLSLQKALANLALIEVSQMDGSLVKGFEDGSVTENDKLILQTNWKGRIGFIQRVANWLYVATRDGTICKFTLKQNSIANLGCMLAFYDCKSSIIGLSLDTESKMRMITVVTSSGFVFRLDENLENVKFKRVSQNCLRLCEINSKEEIGKRILAVDYRGNILNDLGCLVYQSRMPNIVDIKLSEKGRNLIIAAEEGRVLQVKLPRVAYHQPLPNFELENNVISKVLK